MTSTVGQHSDSDRCKAATCDDAYSVRLPDVYTMRVAMVTERLCNPG
jgi:hypothetical protein